MPLWDSLNVTGMVEENMPRDTTTSKIQQKNNLCVLTSCGLTGLIVSYYFKISQSTIYHSTYRNTQIPTGASLFSVNPSSQVANLCTIKELWTPQPGFIKGLRKSKKVFPSTFLTMSLILPYVQQKIK